MDDEDERRTGVRHRVAAERRQRRDRRRYVVTVRRSPICGVCEFTIDDVQRAPGFDPGALCIAIGAARAGAPLTRSVDSTCRIASMAAPMAGSTSGMTSDACGNVRRKRSSSRSVSRPERRPPPARTRGNGFVLDAQTAGHAFDRQRQVVGCTCARCAIATGSPASAALHGQRCDFGDAIPGDVIVRPAHKLLGAVEAQRSRASRRSVRSPVRGHPQPR